MIPFFDANCVVGRRPSLPPGAIWKADDIIKEMRRLDIEGALAVHASAIESDILGGNARITELCEQHDEFEPCYVILPHHTGEMPGGDKLIRYLEKGGARAVRMYPAKHCYKAGLTWCGATYATLAEAGIPLLMDSQSNQVTWSEVDEIMTAHPLLKLILTRVNYRTERILFPLLAKHPGLRVEIELYLQYRGIADICSRFGADRLIYGSGMPVFSAAAAMALVLLAEVEDSEKRKIAKDNLLDLLSGGVI